MTNRVGEGSGSIFLRPFDLAQQLQESIIKIANGKKSNKDITSQCSQMGSLSSSARKDILSGLTPPAKQLATVLITSTKTSSVTQTIVEEKFSKIEEQSSSPVTEKAGKKRSFSLKILDQKIPASIRNMIHIGNRGNFTSSEKAKSRAPANELDAYNQSRLLPMMKKEPLKGAAKSFAENKKFFDEVLKLTTENEVFNKAGVPEDSKLREAAALSSTSPESLGKITKFIEQVIAEGNVKSGEYAIAEQLASGLSSPRGRVGTAQLTSLRGAEKPKMDELYSQLQVLGAKGQVTARAEFYTLYASAGRETSNRSPSLVGTKFSFANIPESVEEGLMTSAKAVQKLTDAFVIDREANSKFQSQIINQGLAWDTALSDVKNQISTKMKELHTQINKELVAERNKLSEELNNAPASQKEELEGRIKNLDKQITSLRSSLEQLEQLKGEVDKFKRDIMGALDIEKIIPTMNMNTAKTQINAAFDQLPELMNQLSAAGINLKSA